MCGISAIFAMEKAIELSGIVPMNRSIRHRGPDDEGYFFFNGPDEGPKIYGGPDTPKEVIDSQLPYCPSVCLRNEMSNAGLAALAHRRLSILDLSDRGHQPLCDREGTLWIVYNGEIYNYLEIRRELENKGYRFQSGTDTEVLIEAYREWGEDCLERLNGMFAFVIYDQKQNKVFAARDRFGVKPLYFWQSPEGFVAFASEIKQFTFLPGWKAILNRRRAHDFLKCGLFDHTEETLFSGVKQLRGGESLVFSPGSGYMPQKKRWYELSEAHFEGGIQDAAERFLELFEDAVRLRLRADVDVGSCLSGGLDSSSIVCVVNCLLREKGVHDKQKTFSACSEAARIDERHYIDLIARHTQVSAHYIYPSVDSLFDDCAQIIWHQDEPFGSTSIYAQWEVFKLANEHGVKVMLDGQGADEQLAGYHGFFGHWFYDLLKSGSWIRLYREMQATKKMHPHLNPLALLGGRLLPEFLRRPVKKMMYNTACNHSWINSSLLGGEHQNTLCGPAANTLYGQSRQQILDSNLPMLLHYEDRNSMAHAVESRTPFLDYRLVEFNLGLSAEMKISNGWTKKIMRMGMKGILPDEVRLRVDKIAFATAEDEWLRQHSTQFKRLLEKAVKVSDGIIHNGALGLFERMTQGEIAFDFTLWRIISFGLWMERFKVNQG